MDPRRQGLLVSHARELIKTHGFRNGNPSWEIIEESWEHDEPLTDEEQVEVYRLWRTARVIVSWLPEV